jgi:hypothetical protein
MKKLTGIILLVLLVPCITFFYGQGISDKFGQLRLLNGMSFLWLAAAIPFLYFQRQAGFPEAIPADHKFQKLAGPFLAGTLFGLLDILVIKVILHPEPYETMPNFLQPFPYSIFLYTSGALDVEIYYRLIPLTIAGWLTEKYVPDAKKRLVFPVMAVLTALREPLEQLPAGPAWFIVYAFTSGFAMNYLQARWYRRSGFTASLAVRLGHYLFWHILLGIYIEYFELA